ncbi:hypothetical protein Patl1_27062 [Pistacia atlantica]|uniref:Uncharacterized protein n=1 Tax=Pistacia atlantica TaxID=434234 RepID=A0ACC1B529_9ROSI|nr:hypothetical protein Patl1_27062 [Pistacia atlantica]
MAICDIKILLSLFESLALFALNGYTLFFDDLISWAESTKWFFQHKQVFSCSCPLYLKFTIKMQMIFLENVASKRVSAYWVHKKQA